MKKIVIGSFTSPLKAGALIEHITETLGVAKNNVSYTYQGDKDDTVLHVRQIDEANPAEGAVTGAMVGGSVGMIAGLATIAGVIPVIGPIFAAGPLITMLGIGAGAVGTTAAGALTGALAGGLAGVLMNLGATEEDARIYEERLSAGDVLVLVEVTDNEARIKEAFTSHEATAVHVYETSANM